MNLTVVRQALLGTAIVAALTALLAAPAGAHEDPPGCTVSGLNFQFDPGSPEGINIIRREGDRIALRVRIRNDAPGACSVDEATVTVRFPAPDGTPTGPEVTVASDAAFPGGMAQTVLPALAEHDVEFDPGVFKGPVSITIDGTAHYPGGDLVGMIGSFSTNMVVSKPEAAVTVTPDPPSGEVPFGVNYAYSVANTSPVDPDQPMSTPAIASPTADHSILSDDVCSSLTFTGGDTTVTFPPLLEVGETWTFTCSHSFEMPGTFANLVSVVGTSTRDGRPWPATTTQGTVTALGADLTVAKSHAGDFTAGDVGRAYNLTVTNSGNEPTAGVVTLSDTIPAGLTATAISGAGWDCSLASLSCNRSDPLAGGASYPAVTVTVDVALDAPQQVTNVATVSGGGESPTANNSAGDPTVIRRPALKESDTTVTVRFAGRKIQLRKGVATVRLTCPASEASPPCRGRLKLETARRVRFEGRSRRLVLAGAAFRIAAGRTKGVRLRLGEQKSILVVGTKAARKVRALVDVRDGAGNERRLSRVLRLDPGSSRPPV